MSTIKKEHKPESGGNFNEDNEGYDMPDVSDLIPLRRWTRRRILQIAGAVGSAGAVIAAVVVAANPRSVEGVAVAASNASAGENPGPAAPSTPKAASPEVRTKNSNACTMFPGAPRSLLKDKKKDREDKSIPLDYSCTEAPLPKRGESVGTPLFGLATMSGKLEASATWAHPSASVRQIELQVADDRSISGASIFGNIAAAYPGSMSVAQIISGYPARFIPDIGNSAVRTTAPKGVSATVVNVPTTEGSRDITIATVWRDGFNSDDPAIVSGSQTLGDYALSNAIGVMLPNALPAN